MISSAILLALMSTQKHRARIPQPTWREPTWRERFIAKGCEPELLDEWLAAWRQLHKANQPSQEEARATRELLEALRVRLIKITSKVQKARSKQLHILSGKSLTQVRQSALDSELKGLQSDIYRLIPRKDARTILIRLISDYCRDCCGEVSNSQIANLLQEATDNVVTEEAVRKALSRQKLSDSEQWAFAANLAGKVMRREFTTKGRHR